MSPPSALKLATVTVFSLLYTELLTANNNDVAQPTEELIQLLQESQSYSAEFQLRMVDEFGDVIQQQSGKVRWVHPNRFRWDILVPQKIHMVIKDDDLIVVDYDLKQATYSSVEKTLKEQQGNPYALFLNPSNEFATEFQVEATNQGFHLIPKDSDPIFKSVDLIFKRRQLAAIDLHDHLGGRTELNFSEIEVNSAFPEDAFEVDIPKGFDEVSDVQDLVEQ